MTFHLQQSSFPLHYFKRSLSRLACGVAFTFVVFFMLMNIVRAQEIITSSTTSTATGASAVAETESTNVIGNDAPKVNNIKFDIKKTCSVPNYPDAALRFGLHGDTLLKLNIDNAGKIDSFELLGSSGWKLLDMTIMQAIIGCQVLPAGNWIPSSRLVRYKWHFETRNFIPGEVISQSCLASDVLKVADSKDRGLGIVVGVSVSETGKVLESKVQWSSDSETLDAEAVRIASSCTFAPAERSGRRIASAESIRFLKK